MMRKGILAGLALGAAMLSGSVFAADKFSIVYIPKNTGNPYFDSLVAGFEEGQEMPLVINAPFRLFRDGLGEGPGGAVPASGHGVDVRHVPGRTDACRMVPGRGIDHIGPGRLSGRRRTLVAAGDTGSAGQHTHSHSPPAARQHRWRRGDRCGVHIC